MLRPIRLEGRPSFDITNLRVVQPILSTNKIIRSSQNSIRTPDPTALAKKAVKAVLSC